MTTDVLHLFPADEVGIDFIDAENPIVLELFQPTISSNDMNNDALASLSTVVSSLPNVPNMSGAVASLSTLNKAAIASLSSLTSTGLSSTNRAMASLSSLISSGSGSGGGVSLPVGAIISYPSLIGSTPQGFLPLSQTSPTIVDATVYTGLVGMYSGGNVQMTIDGSLATTDSDVLAGWGPSRLFDGLLNTEYHSMNVSTPRIITIPLGASNHTLSRVEYQQRAVGGQAVVTIQLQVSGDNGATYIDVGAPQTLGVAASVVCAYDIPTVARKAGRFARLVINASGYAVIGEVRLYEQVAGSVIVPAQPMNAGQSPFIYVGQ